MRNSTLSILSFALIGLFLASCSTSSDLANNSVFKKRRYTKGYQVNIKGNTNDTKKNSVTADMESVETKPVKAIQPDNRTQASLSNEITEADVTPSPIIPIADESTETAKTDRGMTSSSVNTKSESGQASSSTRVSKQYRSNEGVSGTPVAAAPAEGGSLVLYIILAILLPPLAVGLLYGLGGEFWLSLLLTLLFYVPGLIYALIKVFQKF